MYGPIQSGFSGKLVSLTFVRESFHIFYFFLFHEYIQVSLLLYMFNEIKQKEKKILKN